MDHPELTVALALAFGLMAQSVSRLLRLPGIVLLLAGGALLGLGNLLAAQPDRDDAHSSDAVTMDVLRLFGMSEDDAREVCSRPLPNLSAGQPAAS